MTSRERMILAFEHKEPDCVPVSDPSINSPVGSSILGRPAYVGLGGWVAKEKIRLQSLGERDEYVGRYKTDTLELHEKLDLDFIICELVPGKSEKPDVKFINDRKWVITDKSTGLWQEFLFDEKSDTAHEVNSAIKEIGFEAIENHLNVLEEKGFNVDISTLENIAYCKNKAGERRFIFAKPPYLFPAGSSWSPLFMEAMIIEPEICERLCNLYLKRALAYIDEYIKLKVDGIFITGDWAYNKGLLFSPPMVRKYLIPQIKAITELCHRNGIYVVKHTDGNIMEIADEFCLEMGIDGFQSVEPNAGMSIKTMKERYGDKILLMGNVDSGRTLTDGTEQEVINETVQCIRDGAIGGGFVLTSCNSISGGVTAKNFVTMIETVRKYGTYPIRV